MELPTVESTVFPYQSRECTCAVLTQFLEREEVVGSHEILPGTQSVGVLLGKGR